MGWVMIVVIVLIVMTMPATFAAVAVRPSQATNRGAAGALVAFAVLVALLILISAVG